MDYGKFNSAEELLKGYTELEKSFTQKCQQLSILQKQQGTSTDSAEKQVEIVPPTQQDVVDATIPKAQPLSTDTTPTEEQLQQFLDQNPAFALKLLQRYAPNATAPTVMTGGGSMSLALPSKPRTIKEATLMAQKLFN